MPPLDPATTADSAHCLLDARYEAVREAREFTRSTLGRWYLLEHEDDICLVASELVTNALRHALPTEVLDELGPDEPPVRLHLFRHDDQLVCAVRDMSETGPVSRPADDCAAESGRGLFLVEAFSHSWGWHPLSEAEGKVVWALFRV